MTFGDKTDAHGNRRSIASLVLLCLNICPVMLYWSITGSRLAMHLSIDRRERALSTALEDVVHTLKELPLGDVVCEYEDPSKCTWVAERKTAYDLASSLASGRWTDQTSRLHQASFSKVFILIEGDLRAPDFSYQSLLGACMNAELRKNSHVIRTLDADETAMVIKQLCKKAGGPAPGVSSGLSAPILPRSKRERDSTEEIVWIRQLMCVPSISERIARALLNEFGSLPALVQALSGDLKAFPKVRLDARTCLGKTRVASLARYMRAGDRV